MQCSEIQENLSAYLDGELDPDEAAELKSHLEGCELCRSELESLRSTVELVRSVPKVKAPSVLKQRLASATSVRRPAWRFLNPVALTSAAALILVFVVAIFMLNPERLGDSRDLAVGTKEAHEVTPTSKEVPSGRVTDTANDKKLKTGAEPAEVRLGKHPAYAVKEERHKAKEAGTIGKLIPEAPTRLPAYDKALDKRANRETLKDSDSEEGYKGLAEKLRTVERRSGETKPHAQQEVPAPPSVTTPVEKTQKIPPEAEELADHGDEDTREVVIETQDPVATATKVNKILSAHIGKKGVVTGAVLKELAKASENGEEGADDSIEITVYVDRAESEEIIAQLQNLKKQAMAGWAGKAFGEPANEKKKEREPDNSTGTTKRKLPESQEAAKKKSDPARGGGALKKEQEEKRSGRTPKRKTSPDKNFGRPADSSEDGVKEQADLKNKGEKDDQPKKMKRKRVAILIRIVKSKPIPDKLQKALEKEAMPDPAAKGK